MRKDDGCGEHDQREDNVGPGETEGGEDGRGWEVTRTGEMLNGTPRRAYSFLLSTIRGVLLFNENEA